MMGLEVSTRAEAYSQDRDFARWSAREAKIKLNRSHRGQRRFNTIQVCEFDEHRTEMNRTGAQGAPENCNSI